MDRKSSLVFAAAPVLIAVLLLITALLAFSLRSPARAKTPDTARDRQIGVQGTGAPAQDKKPEADAAALTSIKMETPGVFTSTVEDVLLRMKEDSLK